MRNFRFYLSLAFIFTLNGSFSQLHGWDSNVYLPGLGRDDAVCFTLDEIVFIGSGNDGGFNESNVFYAMNTRSGVWQDVAPFPGTARQYARVEEVGFKAYLIGGIDFSSNPLNDVWEYDLINDQWNQKTNFPGAARWKASSFMIGNKIYYGTGRDWNQSYNDLWVYNPLLDTWNQLSDFPDLPRDETIGFSIYERGYVGLGIDCTGVLHEDIWKYDPFADEWVFETNFPGGPRWYAISETLNGQAYVGTGEDDQGNMYSDFWKYDPATKEWTQAESLPNPARRGTAACSIQFKGIFVSGGLSDTFQRLTDISRYTNREFNPPPLRVYFQFEEQKVYIHDLPYYTYVRVSNLSGQLMYETNERIDHLIVDVSLWSKGVYVVSAGPKSAKFLVH